MWYYSEIYINYAISVNSHTTYKWMLGNWGPDFRCSLECLKEKSVEVAYSTKNLPGFALLTSQFFQLPVTHSGERQLSQPLIFNHSNSIVQKSFIHVSKWTVNTLHTCRLTFARHGQIKAIMIFVKHRNRRACNVSGALLTINWLFWDLVCFMFI